MSKVRLCLKLIGIGGLSASLLNYCPVFAQEQTESAETFPPSPDRQLNEEDRNLIPSPIRNSIQIQRVILIPKPNGIDLYLESDRLPVTPPQSRQEENTLITDISNARLGEIVVPKWNGNHPTVENLQIIQLEADTVRVMIRGRNALPQSAITIGTSENPEAKVFARPPQSPEDKASAPIAETPVEAMPSGEMESDDEIEIIVTAGFEEEAAYRVPDASTATKTDTPLRDISQSIQVIPQQVIKDQAATQLKDIVRNVSGVVRADDFGGTGDGFAIRGFQSPNILKDGFRGNSVVSAFSNFAEPTNLEQVEVLKGPASVLYGNVEPGGVINTVTKKPLSDPYYSAGFSAGSFEFFQPEFDLSGPLTQDKALLYRLNGTYINSSSFRDFTQIERFFISPKLSWQISDATKLSFNVDYLNDERPFDNGLVAIGEEVADIPISRRLGEPGDFRKYENLGIGYLLEHELSNSLKLRNTFRADFSDVETQAFRPRGFIDETLGTLEREFRTTQGDRKSYSLQTDLIKDFKTGSVEHQLLLGVELNRIEEDESGRRVRPYAPINIFNPIYGATIPANPPVFFNTAVRYDAIGVYLQDQITVFDNLKLLAGARFDAIRNEVTDNLFDDKTTQNDSALSPRLGIVYQPIEPVSLYASYSRSFNPNVGILDVNNNPLDPERGTQYEAGLKTELLEGKLSATVAYFDITKRNVATFTEDEDFARATGKILSQGVEVDLSGEILPGWKVIASYAYTDARVTEGDEFIAAGNRPASIPRHSGSLWSTYEIQSGTLQGLGFGAGLFVVGERQGDAENTFRLPGYIRADAAIFYRRDNWNISLNAQNLFNTEYFEVAEFRENVQPGAPFTLIGKIGITF